MRRTALAGVLLVLAFAWGAAAGGGPVRPAGPGDGARAGVLNLGIYAAPRGLFHPLLAEDAYDGAVLGLVFDGLIARDGQLGWEPRLAEGFAVSPDQRTITFRLRQGVHWHDGAPFTARDVVYTLTTLLDPRFPGVRSSGYLDIAGARPFQAGLAAGVAGIQAPDPYTVQVTTERPYAPILQALALPIVPEHVFRGTPPDRLAQHPATRRPVGTGPFRFVRYRPDQYVELARNPDYYLGAPRIEKVVYRIVSQELAVAQFLAGELDHLAVRPGDGALLGDRPLHASPTWGYQFMGVNHRHPFLADRRVRQALMCAINRQAMVDRLLEGHGTVVNGPVPPSSWAYDPAGLDPYPYDPARAAALLREAGFQAGPGGWLYRDGRPFRVTLRYPGGNRVRELTAPLIQDNLARVGVRVDLEMLEFATLSREVFDQHRFDLFLMGWSLGADPDPGPLFLPDNRWGRVTGWRDPASEALLDLGVRTLDPAERKTVYGRWNRLLNRELPYLFLYSEETLEAVGPRLRGLRPDRRGALWNIHQVWLVPPEAGRP